MAPRLGNADKLSDAEGSVRCYAEFERLEIELPTEQPHLTEHELRAWVWQNYGDEILKGMKIQQLNEPTDLDKCRKRLDLLEKVAQIQKQYLESEGPKVVYGCLLEGILDLIDSEFGFIGEAKWEEGSMYLHIHATTNIAWDEETREFYARNENMRFYNMDTLFGRVLTHRTPVISNDPKNDPRSRGAPKGHPTVRSFMGIPLFKQDGEILGMVAVANKPGGYCKEDVGYLEPFTVTCGNLIQAYHQIQENERLIDTLEQKVSERTRKLEAANKGLEALNDRVVCASKAQLQHFACMSHEIRTPLNCIIGLLSILQETELTPMQEESMRMICGSGELLVTVVNDVLDYSKLETGNVDIEKKRSSLQETLNSIVHSIDMKASAKNIALKTIYDPAVPEFVHTDGRRLQQVLFNLLGNAIKFSPNGSSVELHVKLCNASDRSEGYTYSPDNVSIPTNAEGSDALEWQCETSPTPCRKIVDEYQPPSFATGAPGCPFTRTDNGPPRPPIHGTTSLPGSPAQRKVSKQSRDCPIDQGQLFSKLGSVLDQEVTEEKALRFIVKDYGKGIERSEFEKIFKPFLQASAETERVYGGTGLGLAITAKLVHGLGGTISVDSEVGCWSSFTIDFPFRDHAADIEGISRRLSDATIFLVNDNSIDDDAVAHLTRSFEEYNTDYITFDNMEDLHQLIRGQEKFLSRDKSYVCLVHEDLYREECYALLSRMARSVLLTFGRRFEVKDTAGHYRSLQQVLPSVLMNSMTNFVASNQESDLPLPKRSYSASELCDLCNVPNRHIRVLVAEDNKINQKVLARMLEKIGVEDFEMVDNGLKAVNRTLEKDYDVILMDMQMPVMDGIEATKEILGRTGVHQKPLVVFVTAHVSHAYEVECTKTGGSDFLPKPFNVREIEKCFERLRQLLSQN